MTVNLADLKAGDHYTIRSGHVRKASWVATRSCAEYPFSVNGAEYMADGRWWPGREDWRDIIAIHSANRRRPYLRAALSMAPLLSILAAFGARFPAHALEALSVLAAAVAIVAVLFLFGYGVALLLESPTDT